MRFHELWEDEEDYSSIPTPENIDFLGVKVPEGFNVVGNHIEDEKGNYILTLGKKHLLMSEDEIKQLIYSSDDE